MRGDTTYPLIVKPGIKRDGTQFEGDYYVDGEWVRWVRGLPRKMLGRRNMYSDFNGPSRGCYGFSRTGNLYVHNGTPDSLQRVIFDYSGGGGGVVDRTPAGFTSDTNNLWTFDTIFDAASSNTALIGHAAPNAMQIDNDQDFPIYYGDVTGTSVLTAVTGADNSGGIVALYPYLFAYGSDGLIKWSDANQPSDFASGDAGEARVTGAKVVKGLIYRGGPTNSPAGLFWSLDSLVRCSYTGDASIFRFDTLTSNTSILAQNSVVEYDGVYFWIANDRFMMFNGVVRELPNQMNLDWFFANLNFNYRNLIWAIKVPRFGEIWWHFPLGDSTVCNHAIIFNIREGTWYDTPISRASGFYRQVFPYPIMFDTDVNGDDQSVLWQHEYGVNEQNGSSVLAIRSNYTTCDISFCATGPNGVWVGKDVGIDSSRLEPDFVQNGDMTLTVQGRDYATGELVESSPYTFSPDTTKIDLRANARQMRFKFESNVANGYYEQGQPVVHIDEGDTRPAKL